MNNTKKEQGTLFRSFSFHILGICRKIVYYNKTVYYKIIRKILYNNNKCYQSYVFFVYCLTKINAGLQSLEPTFGD